jgi:hypothetical protein
MKRHTLFMLIASILAGFLSSMNIWVDKWDDVRLSLNDVYMVGLMSGWMFLFMGVFHMNWKMMAWSAVFVGLFFAAIRGQWFVSERQFMLGMIPHHSMAIKMSKELEKRENNIQGLLDQIVKSQEKEIIIMKNNLMY